MKGGVYRILTLKRGIDPAIYITIVIGLHAGMLVRLHVGMLVC